MVRCGEDRVLEEKEKNGIRYLSFPALEKTGAVKQLFSTRAGGVSEGMFSTMNFSFTRGDKKEHVLENYRRIAEILHCSLEDFVCADQTHTTNIRVVGNGDRGKGVVRQKDYADIDGLVTNEKGIVLVTFFADCVPLYFVDPVRKAIGLSHSGWRGTAGRMGERMVEAMGRQFGSRPEDIRAAIGPSICRDCYEVSEDVAAQFTEMLGGDVAVPGEKAGKYQLDLWLANELILRQAGILPEHLEEGGQLQLRALVGIDDIFLKIQQSGQHDHHRHRQDGSDDLQDIRDGPAAPIAADVVGTAHGAPPSGENGRYWSFRSA